MTAIVLTLIAVPSASGATQISAGNRAEQNPREASDTGAASVDAAVERAAPGTCRSARTAAFYYRLRTWSWQELREGRLATRSPVVAGKSCHWAKFAARTWQARASQARRTFYRWLTDTTLQDFPFADGNRAWPRAVEEVQRVFPGTDSWLLSCSSAEGGHGRWVGYGGQGYSTWLRDSDTVGGPLQFRYSTFTGMYRHAVDYAYAHGFRVPQFTDYTAAWRSALGQALAGGWARYTGNDNSHWSASWGNGC